MATKEQKDELVNALHILKKECDNMIPPPNGNVFVYISLKLSAFIGKVYSIDPSILSPLVISDLLYWTEGAIEALQSSNTSDDIPALNIVVGKLYYQFP
ncbi:hypothetical protein [Serratia marcescens]|uniref:hypothetical protein n=1 Tax=Serratia marcescens TaxID=615 RepID=UPI0027444C97|nr:hypothetical protein [Serratia marcescens]MDP8822084.1 hypothetical protein [Serratia marcescens]MDT0204283.1 hypothetical protein [Serratia marcescens]